MDPILSLCVKSRGLSGNDREFESLAESPAVNRRVARESGPKVRIPPRREVLAPQGDVGGGLASGTLGRGRGLTRRMAPHSIPCGETTLCFRLAYGGPLSGLAETVARLSVRTGCIVGSIPYPCGETARGLLNTGRHAPRPRRPRVTGSASAHPTISTSIDQQCRRGTSPTARCGFGPSMETSACQCCASRARRSSSIAVSTEQVVDIPDSPDRWGCERLKAAV